MPMRECGCVVLFSLNGHCRSVSFSWVWVLSPFQLIFITVASREFLNGCSLHCCIDIFLYLTRKSIFSPCTVDRQASRKRKAPMVGAPDKPQEGKRFLPQSRCTVYSVQCFFVLYLTQNKFVDLHPG